MTDLSALLASAAAGGARTSNSSAKLLTLPGTPTAAGGSGSGSSFRLPGHTGCLWGLHMRVGQWLTVDVEAAWRGSSSGGGDGSQQADELLRLQVALFAVDALPTTAGSGAPCTPTTPGHLDRHGSMTAAMLMGHSFMARSSAATAGTPTAADAAALGSSAGQAQQLVDPGVLLMGCYDRMQLTLTRGGRHTARLHALLAQPGLYVLGVASVQPTTTCSNGSVGVRPAAEKAGGGGGGGGSSGRAFFSQDRLYVYVTR
jgi:hypothetical protein